MSTVVSKYKASIQPKDWNGYIPGTYVLVEHDGLQFELRVPHSIELQINKLLEKVPLTYEQGSVRFDILVSRENNKYKYEVIGT